jgi:endonuclease YncB( thermonuclease family)
LTWAPLAGAFLFFAWLTAAAAASFEAEVAQVLDGDSFLLSDGRQVRLIGINTPEYGKDGAPDQPLAREARARLAGLIERRRVRLTPGREPRDRHGRLLAHAEINGEQVEERLLREGLAWMVAIPPNIAHLERFTAAEQRARAQGLGVWSEPRLQPLEAAHLDRGGFHLVKGRIREVRRGKEYYYLELAPRRVIAIPRDDWREYFARAYSAPERLAGRQVIARGWVSERNGEFRLRVSHPAMLTWP